MPIFNPARNFQGGDLSTNPYGQIVKSGVRMISFKERKSLHLFVLPPFKADALGNGVWYKPVKIRDNFGLDVKEKFPVVNNCPIDYFASKAKMYFPSYTQVSEKTNDKGQKRKVYPSYGRVTTRVLFNAAYVKDLNAGAHVLEVPLSGCAEEIEKWTRKKDENGEDMPLLNNWEAAIPVEFTFDLEKAGNPWGVSINAAKSYRLPQELADSDNLYNLDEVVNYPTIDELMEKLRRVTPADIFSKCMEGYSTGAIRVSMATTPVNASTKVAPAPAEAQEDDVPMAYSNPIAQVSTAAAPKPASVAPSFNIPKASIPSSPAKPAATESNPVAGQFDIESARAFLNANKK